MEPIAQALVRIGIVRDGALYWTFDGHGSRPYSAVHEIATHWFA